MTEADLEQARALSASAAEQGQLWIARKSAEIEALPTGTVVIIDVATGEYVTGKTWLEANPIFDERFGSNTLGFVHRVRSPTFIGGGIGIG